MKVAMIALSPFVSILALAAPAEPPRGADPALLDLQKRAFFHGREYFVLRSGRAQMIIQADRADLGPALTYFIFDARDARQSVAKEKAFNFDPASGSASSALEVILGGFPFTALGHRTETSWHLEGLATDEPSVRSVWWAGGIRVTEQIAALPDAGAFLRSVTLEGANLAGPESVTVRLALPPGSFRTEEGILIRDGEGARLAIAALGDSPARIDAKRGMLEIGPISVSPEDEKPGGQRILHSALLVEIPAGKPREIIDRVASLRGEGILAAWALLQVRWNATSSVGGDPLLAEVFDKARAGLMGMIADDGTMNAGIFEYGAQWVRDTSNTVIGAIHAGHFELAHRALERMLTEMIDPSGKTMIGGGFDEPDREQFDQMGELLHVLKAYRDWTGDDGLIRAYRERLIAMIERPLDPRFRDETGMVHNRREFWERTFRDAYELAYQTWVIQGLRDAADLAAPLGAEDRADRWRAEAARILDAMVSHPSRALVADGRLIKRRDVTGEVALDPAGFPGFQPDVPLRTETHHRILPDATQALPIALGIVDPRSAIARKTLDEIEGLWNARWSDGGYDRYHTSGQPDQPGPWPFATCFILRAQHEAGLYDRSRRSLAWLNVVQGGRAGAWFEEIPSVRSNARTCGIIPWTSGEIALFVVRHVLGVRFEGSTLAIRPALYPGTKEGGARLRFRASRIRLSIDGAGPIAKAMVNAKVRRPDADGALRLPADFAGGDIHIWTVKP
ncbi:MAG: hypothetical protein JXP34_28235 [Planctomycetes bacterium]|nr:hypothetical protein [Planctomycetota bacterium]